MKNFRNTIQKQLIFDAVKQLDIHATAEQVYEHIATKNPAISKATVYRNLSQMAETGILLGIDSFSDARHYDHNTHNHHHFMCRRCRAVFDVEGVFPDILQHIEQTQEFQVDNYSISFSGICKNCKGQ